MSESKPNCRTCDGSGHLNQDEPCWHCDGTGHEPEAAASGGWTPGPWWIWKERAGMHPDDLEMEYSHGVYAGEPEVIEEWKLSGGTFETVVEVNADDEANENGQVRLANARLIAAAPELYEALEQARKLLGGMRHADVMQVATDSGMPADIEDRIDAALRKARGEQ